MALRMAMTRAKQSTQARRTPPPCRVRDRGRMVEVSARRPHSGHRLIFEGSLDMIERQKLCRSPNRAPLWAGMLPWWLYPAW